MSTYDIDTILNDTDYKSSKKMFTVNGENFCAVDGGWMDEDNCVWTYEEAKRGGRSSATNATVDAARAQLKESRKEAKINGWPILDGSSKQKIWAETIRKNAVSTMEVDVRDAIASSQLRADWWINNRDMDFTKYAADVALKLKNQRNYNERYFAAKDAESAQKSAAKDAELALNAEPLIKVFADNMDKLQACDVNYQLKGEKIAETSISGGFLRVFKGKANELTFLFTVASDNPRREFFILPN